ncbi:MAG TPA: oligosaccharide flippase family protein, partial [Solirubrobacteraceae bacterium]
TREPGRGDRLLGTWLALTVPLGLVTIVVGELLIGVVFSAQSAATVHLAEAYMATSVLIMLNWTVVGFVLGEQRFTLYNVVRLASPASVALAYLVLWLAGRLTVATAVWTVAVLQLAFTVLLLVLAVRRHGLARPDRALARETLWYGLKSHGANVSGYLNARLDLLIMPAFLSASSVGLYSVATNVSWIVFAVPGSVSALVLPLAARQDAAAPRMVVRSMWGTLAVATALAVVVGLLAGVAVRAVYGAEFLGSVDALRLLLPGSILYAAAFCPISGLYGANRPFTAAVVQGIGLVVSTAGLLLFLESGGIEAAAIVSTLAYALVFVLAVVVYRHVMKLRWRDLLPGGGERPALRGSA